MRIVQNTNVRGFTLSPSEVRIPAYTDDVALFRPDKARVETVLAITQVFCDVSGAALNFEKSCGFWFEV